MLTPLTRVLPFWQTSERKSGNGRLENDRVMSQRKQSSPFSCQNQTLSVCVQRKQKRGGDCVSYNPERGASVLRVWRLSCSLVVSLQSSGVALIWISVCCRVSNNLPPPSPEPADVSPYFLQSVQPVVFYPLLCLSQTHTHTRKQMCFYKNLCYVTSPWEVYTCGKMYTCI